jgi:hypothetical protein
MGWFPGLHPGLSPSVPLGQRLQVESYWVAMRTGHSSRGQEFQSSVPLERKFWVESRSHRAIEACLF